MSTLNSNVQAGGQNTLCEYCAELFAFISLATIFSPIWVPIWCCIKVKGLIYRIFQRFAAWMEEPPPENAPHEPRTLLGKWLKANKEKVCPLLEWED
jgi:hypothetical protein